MAKNNSCCGIQPVGSYKDSGEEEKTETVKMTKKDECVPCYEESVVPIKCSCENKKNCETSENETCVSPQESMCKRKENACKQTINGKQNPIGNECGNSCGC